MSLISFFLRGSSKSAQCVCVSTSVPKRPASLPCTHSQQQGGIPPLRVNAQRSVNAQRRGSDVVLIPGRDAFLTYLLFKPYKFVPPRAQAVSRSTQVNHRVRLNNTVG